MPEDQDAGAGNSQPPNDPTSEVTLRHRGKDVRMTAAKRDTLAMQGLNQEATQKQINADRAALEADAESYAAFEDFKSKVRANPSMQTGVQAVLDDPDAVVEALRLAQSGGGERYDDDGDHQPTARKPAADGEINQLRQQIAALESRDKDRTVRETVKNQEARIESEISEYPWLKAGTKSHALATERIAQLMASGNGGGLAAATATVASEFRDMFEEEQEHRAKEAQKRTEFRTLRPDRGAPAFKPKEPLTKKSFDDGSMAKNLKAALDSWIG